MSRQPISSGSLAADDTINDTNERPISNSHSWRTLAILSALMAFASISTDLYLPAMPGMAQALGAAHGAMEWTISGYLIGFSLGQLVWGPIGDLYGRRLPVAAGLLLFIIGSAGCALSTDVNTMIAWRMLQAAGACASVVLARAMVRDLYSGAEAACMMSTLMTVMAIAPLIGPSVGSLILRHGSWHAIFWTLVGVGIAALAALFLLPETLPAVRRNPEALTRAFSTYRHLLRNRRLLGYIGCGGCFYGGIYAYVSGTPFAYISYYHLSPQSYGLLFALGIIGIMATNQANARLLAHIESQRLMRWGSYTAAMAGLLLVLTVCLDLGGLSGLVIPLFLYVSATGFIVANAIAGALAISPSHAGALSALVGATQYGTGIIGSALVGSLANGTPLPMAGIIALCGLGCAASALLCQGR